MTRILIIEDDLEIAASLEIRLQATGYRVTKAEDAVQGKSFAVKLQPDLIVLDISLPGSNGLTLAEQFKKLPETAEIPVIAITASKDAKLREKAMSLHLAGFFEKPYEFDELLATIHMTLNGRARSPLRPGSPSRAGRAANRAAYQPIGARQKKILIVEDDAKLAMALALRLKSAGYETVLAFDAVLGLSNAVKLVPDLVLLDISMPAGDGLELAHKVRNLLVHPPPIIFLTASRQAGLREKALQLGAAGFFEKPYEAEDLMAAVHIALEAEASHASVPADDSLLISHH